METRFLRTYTCKPKTLERFKQICNNDIYEFTEVYTNTDKTIGLVKIDVVLSNGEYVKPELGRLKIPIFLGRYNAYISKISNGTLYGFQTVFVRGDDLKMALKTIIDNGEREMDLWLLSEDGKGESAILGLGNDNGLVITSVRFDEPSEYRDYKDVFKIAEVKINKVCMDRLIKEWIMELGIP